MDNAHINISINININSLLPPSRSSSKYDLRGKCRRTCIRQGTRYGRAIAPTLMELLHAHPTIYNTSTSVLLPTRQNTILLELVYCCLLIRGAEIALLPALQIAQGTKIYHNNFSLHANANILISTESKISRFK